MGNMSYCRFQNTCGDLRDCRDILMEMVESIGMSEEACVEEGLDHANSLSPDEANAALDLLNIARELNEIHEADELVAALRKAAGRDR